MNLKGFEKITIGEVFHDTHLFSSGFIVASKGNDTGGVSVKIAVLVLSVNSNCNMVTRIT